MSDTHTHINVIDCAKVVQFTTLWRKRISHHRHLPKSNRWLYIYVCFTETYGYIATVVFNYSHETIHLGWTTCEYDPHADYKRAMSKRALFDYKWGIHLKIKPPDVNHQFLIVKLMMVYQDVSSINWL